MTNLKTAALATAALAAITLVACDRMGGGPETSLGLGKAKGLTPVGTPFDRALYTEYLALSQAEYNGGDYIDSDLYADNARLAAAGNPTGPMMPIQRRLPIGTADELSASYFRLTFAFAAKAKERAPQDAARAQVMYDCWLEQAEENHQARDIAACREGFLAALTKVEGALLPAPTFVAQAPAPETFTVYFPYNRATLDRYAQMEVNYIVNRARTLNAQSITLAGYTDRSGKDDYNLKLSRKREATVHKAIAGAGLNASLTGEAFGETQLAMATPDGVREASNRRVVVVVTPSAPAPVRQASIAPPAPRASLTASSAAPPANAMPALPAAQVSVTPVAAAPEASATPTLLGIR